MFQWASQEPLYDQVVKSAAEAGILTIAVAGNNADRQNNYLGSVIYPAASERALAIGAVALNGAYANFSPGPQGVGVFAPGVKIITVDIRGENKEYNGTSPAAAIVSAIVAAALSLHPKLTNDQILTAVKAGSERLKSDGPLVLRADKFWQAVGSVRR
jgi:subtilisin family serine protease